MGGTILPDLATEILIPVCAIIGIGFSLIQWMLVSKVKLVPAGKDSGHSKDSKNGYGDYLIEEEEALNDHNVVLKCAEIQNAISEGNLLFPCLWISVFFSLHVLVYWKFSFAMIFENLFL